MIRFTEVFGDEAIVSTLWIQLSWSHFKEIIYQKDALQRDFYTEMCRVERWSRNCMQRFCRQKRRLKIDLNLQQVKRTMDKHVNAISDRLSLRPPQRVLLEILHRIIEIAFDLDGQGAIVQSL